MSGKERHPLPRITSETWVEDDGSRRMRPLHSEWATGTIGPDDREYRILKSEQGPHILIELEGNDHDEAFHVGDLLQHAHAKTKELDSDEEGRNSESLDTGGEQ